MKQLYAERDVFAQGQYYCGHIVAMTSEGLQSKSDIAAELAHRDIKINELVEALESARHMLWAAKNNMQNDGSAGALELAVMIAKEDLCELDKIIEKAKS